MTVQRQTCVRCEREFESDHYSTRPHCPKCIKGVQSRYDALGPWGTVVVGGGGR